MIHRSSLVAAVLVLGCLSPALAQSTPPPGSSASAVHHRHHHHHHHHGFGWRCSTRAGVFSLKHRQELGSHCRVHVRHWGRVSGRTVR